jgi:hypothetical protein
VTASGVPGLNVFDSFLMTMPRLPLRLQPRRLIIALAAVGLQ